MAEVYNLPTPHYYVVAVTKQRDNSSELIYLKRKSTCHTGVSLIFIIWMLLGHSHLHMHTFCRIVVFLLLLAF